MDISKVKNYIYSNNKIEFVLKKIKCKYIQNKGEYFQCGNYNGDNKQAVIVYKNEMLYCENYTRDIKFNSKHSDLINLVMYNKSLNLFQAIKYLCDILELDYYYLENDDDIPESIKLLNLLEEMQENEEFDDIKLVPISETILSYYKPYCNEMFKADNINYNIQKLFQIGYDELTNYITIPIRDELGSLIGVKGRYFGNDYINKYMYLEKCNKSKILFGLDKSYDFIRKRNKVYVVESEKAVMQLWSMGYRNCVSTGGKKISSHQINKLCSLGVEIVIVYDKDVLKPELEKIASQFPNKYVIKAIIDYKNLLTEKESPTDVIEKWEILKDSETKLFRSDI